MQNVSISNKLLKALNRVDRGGGFCASLSVAPAMPGLKVKGMGSVGLPLKLYQEDLASLDFVKSLL